MIEKFTGFRAMDKSSHDDASSAWRRNLYLWLRKYGCENDAIANAIVAAATKGASNGDPDPLTDLRTIVNGLAKHTKRRAGPGDRAPTSGGGNAPSVQAVAGNLTQAA